MAEEADYSINMMLREDPRMRGLMRRLDLKFGSDLPENPKKPSEWPEYRDGLNMSEYWDREYGKDEAWQTVRFKAPVIIHGKALLVTLDDDTQMWVPQFVCTMWRKRSIDVHTLHWEELLAAHKGTEDLLPDLDDDEL